MYLTSEDIDAWIFRRQWPTGQQGRHMRQHRALDIITTDRDYRLMTALMRLKHVKMADRLVVLETVRRLEAGR